MSKGNSRVAKAERNSEVQLVCWSWLTDEKTGPKWESNFLKTTQHIGRAGAQSPRSQANTLFTSLHTLPLLLHPHLYSSINQLPVPAPLPHPAILLLGWRLLIYRFGHLVAQFKWHYKACGVWWLGGVLPCFLLNMAICVSVLRPLDYSPNPLRAEMLSEK